MTNYPTTICWRPVLTVLARTLCRELDELYTTRAKYRQMRLDSYYRAAALDNDGPWPVPPPPMQTPYDHVIDRLDNALQDTYKNLEAIQNDVYEFLTES